MGAWGRFAGVHVVSSLVQFGESPPAIAGCSVHRHSSKFTHAHRSKPLLVSWVPDPKEEFNQEPRRPGRRELFLRRTTKPLRLTRKRVGRTALDVRMTRSHGDSSSNRLAPEAQSRTSKSPIAKAMGGARSRRPNHHTPLPPPQTNVFQQTTRKNFDHHTTLPHGSP
jgi:hypothetical protein